LSRGSVLLATPSPAPPPPSPHLLQHELHINPAARVAVPGRAALAAAPLHERARDDARVGHVARDALVSRLELLHAVHADDADRGRAWRAGGGGGLGAPAGRKTPTTHA
jgi:hypothetical protein